MSSAWSAGGHCDPKLTDQPSCWMVLRYSRRVQINGRQTTAPQNPTTASWPIDGSVPLNQRRGRNCVMLLAHRVHATS
eukprot:1375626-Lingulodinium_polyedra.AAC.1